MTIAVLGRLGAHDRALMLRCALAPSAPWRERASWKAATHLGGTGPSLLAAGLPWFACCAAHRASALALVTVTVSHVIVQLVKRTVVRVRPSVRDLHTGLVPEPDRFSFPSGHATASMAVALSYGTVFPDWAMPLAALAALVGFSRIRLGVHYPSDVLIGQLIAGATAAGVRAVL
jgi:undecaprenyl-diphosphatase